MTPSVYWHGCNYPWSTDGTTVYYGLDFGANVWGSHLGVSTRQAAIARDFSEMAALGFTVVRWFVFCDGRAGIVFDERGRPDGLDPHVLADLDVAVATAISVGIRLVLVMLDHRFMFSGIAGTVSDPLTGATMQVTLPTGRSQALLSPGGVEALVEHVLQPVVVRYAPEGARADLSSGVLAYELMNEPDFVVEEWEADLSPRVRRPLPFAVLADAVARFSDLVHSRSSALTTLGGARLQHLWAWDDAALGLDVLQVHSYPNLRRPASHPDLLGTPASAHAGSRPLLIGECPGNAAERCPAHVRPPDTTLDEYLEFAVTHGYRGAWPWSFSGTDVYGPLPREPLRLFARAHPELVNPRCRL